MRSKAAYVFPLVLFAALAVGLLSLIIYQYQSSNRQRYKHLNEYQAAFNIAYSALVGVLAEVEARQWRNRPFKDGPKDYSGDLFGGQFFLRVADHASEDFVFNLRVRTKVNDKSHLFYWRLEYNPNLLDFTDLFILTNYKDFGEQNPDSIGIDEIVDGFARQKNTNRPMVEKIANAIDITTNLRSALKVLGIEASDNVAWANTPRSSRSCVSFRPHGTNLSSVSNLVAAVDPTRDHLFKKFYFGNEITGLTAEQKEILDGIVDILNAKPEVQLELRGHASSDGYAERNMELSIQRARNVATFLINAGIPEDRIEIVGCGDTTPIATNATLEGQRKNRRVEFVLKNKT